METTSVTASKALSGNIEMLPFSIDSLTGLLLLTAFLLICAIISGSKTALFSFEPKDLESLKADKKRSSQVIDKLLSDKELLRASLLTGHVTASVAVILLASHVSSALISFGGNANLELIFKFVFISVLLLLFGNIMPRTIAASFPLAFACYFASFLNVLGKITIPVNLLMIVSAKRAKRMFAGPKRNLSADEISKALKASNNENLTEDKEILEGIVTFGNKSVSEIMHPRLDIVSIDFKSNYLKVLEIVREAGYSRIPVHSGTLDQIRGILYIKDLLPHINKGISFKWQQLVRPPFFVPETKKIDDLLEEFQKSKVHLAVVVDEYGGTSGLVTLEDILEEIVGDIEDEFDVEEQTYIRLEINEFLFEGKTLLNDFCKIVDCRDDIFEDIRGDAETLAGLFLELTGEFPKLKDKVSYRAFTFQVEAFDQRRIKEIRVTINSNVEKS